MMRRTLFGVLTSMIIGGLGFAAGFEHPGAILINVYAFPFIIFYGIPVSMMAHRLTRKEKHWAASKRLLVYIVMGGWLPALLGSIAYFTQGIYDVLEVFLIVIFMLFAFGFWIGEELFERTKLKEWTEADLSKNN